MCPKNELICTILTLFIYRQGGIWDDKGHQTYLCLIFLCNYFKS